MRALLMPVDRWLTLEELCDWLNITPRHARKLVARGAIPYRKVGHLLRFTESEIEAWSRPKPRQARPLLAVESGRVPATSRRLRTVAPLPKSLID